MPAVVFLTHASIISFRLGQSDTGGESWCAFCRTFFASVRPAAHDRFRSPAAVYPRERLWRPSTTARSAAPTSPFRSYVYRLSDDQSSRHRARPAGGCFTPIRVTAIHHCSHAGAVALGEGVSRGGCSRGLSVIAVDGRRWRCHCWLVAARCMDRGTAAVARGLAVAGGTADARQTPGVNLRGN